jgi:excisionase family DNA binding protein
MNEIVYTIPEVAQFLKISKSKVYYLVKRNEIPHIRIQRNVRILQSDLVAWLKMKKSQEPSQMVFVIDRMLEVKQND